MDIASILFSLVSIFLGIYRFLTSTFNHWYAKNVPSLSDPLPGFGYILPAITLRENLGSLLHKIYNQSTASMIGIYYLRKPALIVRDPELVKSVLQTSFSSFYVNMVHVSENDDPVMARDPFFSKNMKNWREGRARVTSHLSNKKLKHLSLIIEGVSRKMSAYIDGKIENGSEEFECGLKELFLRCTGELVANAAFGIQGKSFEDNSKERPFAKLADMIYTPTLINALRLTLVLYFPGIARFFKIKLMTKKSEMFLKNVVEKTIKQRKNQNVTPNDYLQFCMEANKDDIDGILSDLLIFYDDVYETVSSTLASLFYHLSINPKIQEKLRESLVDVVEASDNGLSYESQKNMDYLEQVIFEAMRVTSPVGFLAKLCTEEITLEGSDNVKCSLEIGDLVIISTLGLHLDEKYWPNPETFDPERFSPENQASRHKYTFLPFSLGPRQCVGVRMAITMVKLISADLLLKYSVEFSSKTRLPLVREPTQVTYIKGDLWVKFKKLQMRLSDD